MVKALRRVLPLLAGLALLATTAGCEWPEGTRFVHRVFDEGELEVTRDVVYRSTTDYLGNPIDLRLDIYQPPGDTRSERPVVMWMFGGGFTSGQKEHMAPYAEDSARRGYVGVTIQYRLRNQGGIEAAVDAWADAVGAVDWLKAHATDYRIDTDAIVAGGYSAGAITAMNLLYLSDPSPVAGAVAVAGFTIVNPTAGDPPALMHQGMQDQVLPPNLAVETCNKAKAAGDHCTFFEYQGDHFIAYVPPETAAQIKDRTADWIFEQILWPLGYREETASGPRLADAG